MISPRSKICSTLRRFLPLFLLLYFLLLTVLLLKVPTDISPHIRHPHSLLYPSPEISSHQGLHQGISHSNVPISNRSEPSQETQPQTTQAEKGHVTFDDPKPLSVPVTKHLNDSSGSFYAIRNDVFIYSAYFDDRKKDIFVRLMTLTKQIYSRSSVFCHFKDEIYEVTRKAQRYELCENHNKQFGGYIFSCEVPEFLNTNLSHQVNVSYGKSKQRFVIPLTRIRPPGEKLKYLDYYEDEPYRRILYSESLTASNAEDKESPRTLHLNNFIRGAKSLADTENVTTLSFAVCVPPLFGDISPYRLIEFIELTLLLGADHIFFYKFDVTDDIQTILDHYVTKGVITLTQWSLPRDVTSDKVWYNGQLLAHNDCLYRSMPRFDLVAFNDVDEFVIPHNNENLTSWSQVFPRLVTKNVCGLSFQSAFYDPGLEDYNDPQPLTPKLTSKTKDFSSIRSKVMLVPWRVFEVGIHHVSKQNRETWTVRRLHPATAFLHHYRQCDGYDISCGVLERENIVERKYSTDLKKNYDKAVGEISPQLNITGLRYRSFWFQ